MLKIKSCAHLSLIDFPLLTTALSAEITTPKDVKTKKAISEKVFQHFSLFFRRARMEMLAALKARREALESKMKEKKRLLKELCIKEGKHLKLSIEIVKYLLILVNNKLC